ncbi:hypothetical protein EDD86DRAFT_250111 [Gorgonomyces haynaldii]|nr:hypothetical protein EDD86DRAFT_250111 [Gorgonomyces haynaldii]
MLPQRHQDQIGINIQHSPEAAIECLLEYNRYEKLSVQLIDAYLTLKKDYGSLLKLLEYWIPQTTSCLDGHQKRQQFNGWFDTVIEEHVQRRSHAHERVLELLCLAFESQDNPFAESVFDLKSTLAFASVLGTLGLQHLDTSRFVQSIYQQIKLLETPEFFLHIQNPKVQLLLMDHALMANTVKRQFSDLPPSITKWIKRHCDCSWNDDVFSDTYYDIMLMYYIQCDKTEANEEELAQSWHEHDLKDTTAEETAFPFKFTKPQITQFTSFWSDKTMLNEEESQQQKMLKIDPSIALETANMLGLPTFSQSFIDRLVETSYNPIPAESFYLNDMTQFMAPMDMLYPKQEPLPLSPQEHLEISSKEKSRQTMVNRRKTMQKEMHCMQCASEVGVVFIRGNKAKDSVVPDVHLTCTCCESSKSSSKTSTTTKKRKRVDSTKVECEVCKSTIGTGGVDVSHVDSDMKIEYICTDCSHTYMFCSECGGGGKQRTGKWRPRQLFDQGRRTCSLPHIRVGSVPVHYRVIKLSEMTPGILSGLQDVFFDCYFSLFCIPSVMGSTRYGSFQQVRQEIERLWQVSVLDVIQQSAMDSEKYITLAWIQKRHRNKGAGRAQQSQGKEGVNWLQRLNLNGIIPAFDGETEEERNQCFVAFSISEWNPSKKALFVSQMAPRSVFLKTMEGYLELLRTTIDHVKQDAFSLGIAQPRHIWCWTKSDHVRLQSIPPRLRFIPKAAFLRSHPDVDPNVFEKDYEPLQQDGTVVYCAPIQDLLRP